MGGTDGVFAPILKHLLESMFEGLSQKTIFKRIKLLDNQIARRVKSRKELEAYSQGVLYLKAVAIGMVL